MGINAAFWNGKRVLVTGHTGFKGSWLCLWLHRMGARISGVSLPPPTNPSLFELARISEIVDHHIVDVRDFNALSSAVNAAEPQIVFHMAAQPLVREAYSQPLETYMTNVMGTAHLLEATRTCENLKAVVVITTDKCYENKELGRPFTEGDPLGGHDPYSASKACAEIVTSSYRDSFFVGEGAAAVASVRAGNVIGGGDFAKDRIVPDIIRAWESGEAVIVRNPFAIRPWQDVLEPLGGYLILAERLYKQGHDFAGAYNFGPTPENCREVGYITDELCRMLGGSWSHDGTPQPHEAQTLLLSSEKAHKKLGWRNCLSLEETLKLIADFAVNTGNGEDARAFCESHIFGYEKRFPIK